MENPFQPINERLKNLEGLTLEIYQKINKQPSLPAAQPDELLTPEETAQLLKVTKVTVWDWQKKGILKKHTIGNQVRYLRSEVLEAVTKRGKAA